MRSSSMFLSVFGQFNVLKTDILVTFFSNLQTISKPVEHPSELPKWNYDGSSTGQAPGEDSEVIL